MFYLKLIFYCFIITNFVVVLKCEEEPSTLVYVDEVVILKKLFTDLNEIKNAIKDSNSSKNLSTPTNCAEATSCTHRSGIYKILVEKYSSEPFLVECDEKTQDGDWIVIQRRQDGSVDFYRDWAEYRRGFGNIEGEFFIGMDKLYALTNFDGPQELLILMEDAGYKKYAKYSTFMIDNESNMFSLQQLGMYSGDAGDSLSHHLGGKFSTKDRDNDDYDGNCATAYTGAWWYKKCHVSNLNGKYGDVSYAKGVTWHAFRGYNVSVKYVKMMIRRRRN